MRPNSADIELGEIGASSQNKEELKTTFFASSQNQSKHNGILPQMVPYDSKSPSR